MIPKKLRIKDFLSYGAEEQELDFDSFQLAVLTGENGAGKSSLMEAIPFCIWGEGRDSRQEIPRKGAKEACVQLEFEMQNNIYRITRILRLVRETTNQTLEFAIYDRSINDFRPLTCERITDTEDEIQKRIGISHDTFINSVFFAQGKADLFIKNKPKERRKVLGEILGLSRYEALSEKAKKFAKDTRKNLEFNRTRISLLESDVASLPELCAQHQAKHSEEQDAKNKLDAINASLLAIDSDLQAFQKKQNELAILTAELTSLVEQLNQEKKQIQVKHTEISAIELHLQTRDELLETQRHLEAIKAEVQSLEHLQSRAQTLKEQIASIESDYKTKRAKLEAEKKSAQEQLFKLNQMIAQRKQRVERKAQFLEAHREVKTKIVALKKACARLPEIESLRDATKTKISDLKSAIASAEQQMSAISEKGKTVKELSNECPLCKSSIDEARKTHIVETYRNEYRAHQTNKKNNEDKLQTLQQELLQKEQEIASLKQKEQELQQCLNDLNKITAEMALLEEVERELKQLESDKVIQEAKRTEAELGLQSLANTASQIETLNAKLSEIGYDPAAHEQKKRALKEFEFVPAELAKLDSEAKRREMLLQEISQHRKNSELLEQKQVAKEQACNILRQDLQGKAIVEQQKQSSLKEKQHCENRLMSLSAERQALEKLIAEKKEKESLIRKLQEEIAPEMEKLELYEDLTKAYSVEGVQALLLEKAIPEIERLANELLAQLTNNLFSLSFQTEQEKTGAQTLQVIISDANANTRPYETFSGGERFRIDFSLRLALSKYLATISGTPIKMLIIDEGFGTQDQIGIDAMIEAINQVSNDFEKLILITHLEEMKDAFPTRIVVKKDPIKGSYFEVIS